MDNFLSTNGGLKKNSPVKGTGCIGPPYQFAQGGESQVTGLRST
jgi:hypothetical protein